MRKAFRNYLGVMVVQLLNAVNTTELYTLKGWTLWYVDYVSIFKSYKKSRPTWIPSNLSRFYGALVARLWPFLEVRLGAGSRQWLVTYRSGHASSF